ncbi:MAG: tellurium resistance protein TerC [Planctomycetota bacterium]
MLILLQAVLGFDNLLYISLESKRVEESKQSYVRKSGIAIAIILRIVLLFVILLAIDNLTTPFFSFGLDKVEDAHVVADLDGTAGTADDHTGGESGDEQDIDSSGHEDEAAGHGHEKYKPNESGRFFAAMFNIHSAIVLAGGIFIIYTAFKEIMHMLAINHLEGHKEKKKKRSAGSAIFWIVLMNLVFSFDSILSAIALTHNVWVMGTAIIVSGLLMIFLADTVAKFLEKNRMYEVLGLFILFIVGIMLVSEGAHLAHMHLFGNEVTPMTKTTFYFVIGILVFIDIVQTRYQKKLMAEIQSEQRGSGSHA